MPDFDEQWKNVSGEEAVKALMRPQQYACNEWRVKEFRKNLGIRDYSYTPDEVRAWYAEEGFVKVRTGCMKHNINMIGERPA